jgi:anti-anti-sigma regulatory factor
LGTRKPVGEIDSATAVTVRAVMRANTDNSEPALVSVDSPGVTFMESAEHHVVVSATEFAAQPVSTTRATIRSRSSDS